ncbi:hypothetical protein B0T22DRAFT_247185 [Podospora appendiculata]|uniref:Ketoreductase domain-containing protein n=1 Tax=Podospora appendiculata TaxID=314037 RepID=A0AAE1C8V9_9PEZI|nr:hypothetical protein B0T22DRAFT_247185 [Podospora appendiculata]
MTVLRSLTGKTVAITGGAGGIGFAIAKRFAHEGASVVLLGRNERKLQEALGYIKGIVPPPSTDLSPHIPPPAPHSSSSLASSRGGGGEVITQQQRQQQEKDDQNAQPQQHAYVVHDVRELDSWNHVSSIHPDINILVNCAGVTQTSALTRLQPNEAQEIIATNLRGAVWGCKVIGRKMSGARRLFRTGVGGDSIINVSSLLAVRGCHGTAVYAASKAGLLGLTTALANEYGRAGIRVNAILPGYIMTDMTKDLPSESLVNKIPLRRFGTPEEVADAAAFLAKNLYANNCMLTLDGGLSAT